jgi:anaerobic selenocysteine-containing dehydrogenase
VPNGLDELEWLSRLAERFGIAVDPWAAPTAAEQAVLPPGDEFAWTQPDPHADTARPAEPGLELVRYRALFSGAAVERVPQLQFQRPGAEVELAHEDATTRDISPGATVRVSSNGTSKELRASLSRKLRPGVVRIAAEHATGLGDRVQVEAVDA